MPVSRKIDLTRKSADLRSGEKTGGKRGKEIHICAICGDEIPEEETYFDCFHDSLCADCLLDIHKAY